MSSQSLNQSQRPDADDLDIADPVGIASSGRRKAARGTTGKSVPSDLATYKRTFAAQIRNVQDRLLHPVPDILYAEGVIGILPNGGVNTVGKQVRHFLSQAEHILTQLCSPELSLIDLEGRSRDREAEVSTTYACDYADTILALLNQISDEDRTYTFKSEYGEMRGTITSTSLFEQQIQHGITHGAAIIAAGLPQAKRSVWLKSGRALPKVLRFQVYPDLFIAPSTPLGAASGSR